MNKERSVYLTGPELQEAVENYLLRSMGYRPYQSITVADICREVNIARKTFYVYYANKDDCFYAIIDRVINRVNMYMYNHLNESSALHQYYYYYLEAWKREKTFLDIILRDNLDRLFIQRGMQILRFEEKQIPPLLDHMLLKADTDILRSYLSCDLLLVLQWAQRNFDTPLEEMAKKFVRLFHYPMIPLSEADKLWL